MSETPTKKLLEMLRQGSAACAGQWAPEAADEIERLRAALRGVIKAWVNPADGGEYERGEVPALDAAREALNSYEQLREKT